MADQTEVDVLQKEAQVSSGSSNIKPPPVDEDCQRQAGAGGQRGRGRGRAECRKTSGKGTDQDPTNPQTASDHPRLSSLELRNRAKVPSQTLGATPLLSQPLLLLSFSTPCPPRYRQRTIPADKL